MEIEYHNCNKMSNCIDSVSLPDHGISKIKTLNGVNFVLEIESVDRTCPTMRFKSIDGVLDMMHIMSIYEKIYGNKYMNGNVSYNKQGMLMKSFFYDNIVFEIPKNTIIDVTYIVPYIKNKQNIVTILYEYNETEYQLKSIIDIHNDNEYINIQI